MKITELKLIILEDPDSTVSMMELTRVPNVNRLQFTHTSAPTDKKVRQAFLKVITDTGVEGMCTTMMKPDEFAILKHQVIGENAFDREYLYQKLHKGTRWVYMKPGWFGDFDNCLWDIAGKAAGLPMYALLGRVRDRFPVYLTGGDMPVQGYLEHIAWGRDAWGVGAYKFHTYKGGRADMKIFTEVREKVGPDYALLNDPVCSYTLNEAIEVGRLMEDLDFIWLEEPMHEQKMHQYQILCDALTIPVMGNETLMHDSGLSTQWLMHGATDLLRGNARHGTTQILKMAHFAEMYDTTIELNAHGGLFALLHAHLGCCIENTSYYEIGSESPRDTGLRWGMTNGPEIIDGHLAPPDGPGWGAEWDWDRFNALVVETY